MSVTALRVSARMGILESGSGWRLMLGNAIVFIASLAVQWVGWGATAGHQNAPNRDDLLTTLLLTAFVVSAVSFRAEARFLESVRTGNLVFDFIRPASFLTVQFGRLAGSSAVSMLTVLPICVLIAWLADIDFAPRSLPSLLLTGAFAVIALLLNAILSVIACLLAAVLGVGTGIILLRQAVIALFGGAVIPMAILPHEIQYWSALLPFAGAASNPGMAYVGSLGASPVLVLLTQGVWIVLLYILLLVIFRYVRGAVAVRGG